jgi:hypothetical protein
MYSAKVRKTLKKRMTPEWYAIEARFVCQIENRRKGLLRFEDRVYLLKAFFEEDAVKRFKKRLKNYEVSYLNMYKERVRMKFEKILYAQEVMDRKIGPEGTEVYWKPGNRRMKPKDIWRPKKRIRK